MFPSSSSIHHQWKYYRWHKKNVALNKKENKIHFDIEHMEIEHFHSCCCCCTQCHLLTTLTNLKTHPQITKIICASTVCVSALQVVALRRRRRWQFISFTQAQLNPIYSYTLSTCRRYAMQLLNCKCIWCVKKRTLRTFSRWPDAFNWWWSPFFSLSNFFWMIYCTHISYRGELSLSDARSRALRQTFSGMEREREGETRTTDLICVALR